MALEHGSNVREIRPGARDQHGVTSRTNGTGGDGMEARVAKLESDVGNIKGNIGDIKKDIRELRNWLLGGFLILMGAFATGYLRLADKIENASAVHENTLKEIRDRLPSGPAPVPARKP